MHITTRNSTKNQDQVLCKCCKCISSRSISIQVRFDLYYMFKMLSVYLFLGLLASSFPGTYAYVDFGTQTLLSVSYFDPTVRPHQLPTDLRQEILPSMITAVSPIITMAPNGSSDTSYSLHYHDLFKKTKEGRGIFKRGVFANDPPFSTCRQCGVDTASYSSTTTGTCVTKTYHVGHPNQRQFNLLTISSGRFPVS